MGREHKWPADRVYRRDVSALVSYAKNARLHSDAQIVQIADSIREFGWTIPVLVDDENKIIAGHGRILAADRLGIKKIPVMVASGWSDAQKRAYVLADNKIAENAGWDDDLVRLELSEIDALGFDLTLTGFDSREIAALLAGEIEGKQNETSDPGSDVDPFPCHAGDIFKIGPHVVACGDSSDFNLIDRILDGDVPSVVLYDPPFEVEDAWGWLYPANQAVVFCDYKTVGRAVLAGAGFEFCYHFVWDGVTSWYTPNRPLARHKSALVFKRDPKWNFDDAVYHDGKERETKTVSNTRGKCKYKPLAGGMVHLQTVFQMGNTRVDDSGHSHSKPLEWVRALMLGCGVGPESVVLDQFAGSASFTVAAPLGASVRSIEIDPSVCGKAVTRLAGVTGCRPERV